MLSHRTNSAVTPSFLLKTSRPRFWLYLLGPLVLGFLAATPSTALLPLIAFLALYFSFPANLLIYGVNDIFDFQTDKHNAKKGEYEVLMHPEKQRGVLLVTTILNLLFLVPIAWIELTNGGFLVTASLFGFLFFGIFYSAPPIRAKTVPFLDSFFNILYVFPGIVGYLVGGGNVINLPILVAATAWCMAMHAFSAVPDIEADTKAGIATVATKLGAANTLTFCATLYATATILTYPSLGYHVVVLGAGYVAVMLSAKRALNRKGAKGGDVFRIYTSFPLLNTAAGAVLTILLLRNWLT